MKKLSVLVAGMLAALVSLSAFADEEIEQARNALISIIGDPARLSSFEETEISSVYRANIEGQIIFVFVRDNHLIYGDAINLATGVSLSDEIANQAIVGVVERTSVEDMVVFAAKGEAKRYMTVFTDIDCGYCRRLHQEVPTLNEAGLEVRYMAYPRAGIGSASYDKIVTVWCDADPQTAMTVSKRGEKLPFVTCENPVATQFTAGVEAGIGGTPTLVLDDGTVIGGYVPAEELLPSIGLSLN